MTFEGKPDVLRTFEQSEMVVYWKDDPDIPAEVKEAITEYLESKES